MTGPPSWPAPSDALIDATWTVAARRGCSLSRAYRILETRARAAGRPLDDVALDMLRETAGRKPADRAIAPRHVIERAAGRAL